MPDVQLAEDRARGMAACRWSLSPRESATTGKATNKTYESFARSSICQATENIILYTSRNLCSMVLSFYFSAMWNIFFYNFHDCANLFFFYLDSFFKNITTRKSVQNTLFATELQRGKFFSHKFVIQVIVKRLEK